MHSGTTSIAASVRSRTELFRYEPSNASGLDIFAWMRAAAMEAGNDPDRCALVTLDDPNWTDEVAPNGRTVRILGKRGVILTDDDRAFSFIIVTGGGGNWSSWVERVSDWRELDPEERAAIGPELTETWRLLLGEVFFPPAKFLVAYPRRERGLPWGALLAAVKREETITIAYRRDGTVERSPLPTDIRSDVGGWHRLPQWIEDPYTFAADQARREKPLAQFRCPCCGYLTLMEWAAYETCPVCWWEDDGQDDPHADERWGGPNRSLTLTEARENFRRWGAVEERLVPHARPPTPDEA